jgi:hypothetical protein
MFSSSAVSVWTDAGKQQFPFRACAEWINCQGQELACPRGMNICVHTSHGRRGEAEPHVFFVGGHRLIVASILGRWTMYPHHYYEVTGDDGRGFLLRYDSARDAWELAGVFARRHAQRYA